MERGRRENVVNIFTCVKFSKNRERSRIEMLGNRIMTFRVLIFERGSYTSFFLYSFHFLGHQVLISVSICSSKNFSHQDMQ